MPTTAPLSAVDGKMVDLVYDLTMDEENDQLLPEKTPEELAELKKESGNQKYKVKDYKAALSLYTDAIDLYPSTAAYYGNRSACYLMLGMYKECIDDARRAVMLDPTYDKGYTRILKCAIALGDLTTAETTIATIQEKLITPGIDVELRQVQVLRQYESEMARALEKKDYRKIVYCMDRCLDQAPSCARYKVVKAECLAFLGRYEEAQELVNGVLHFDKGNADAIFVRGVCLYYEDNIDSAFQHFIQVLRLAPDHEKAKEIYKRAKQLKRMKEEGNQAFKQGKMKDAAELYSQALLIDVLNKKTNAKLYFNRALAYAKTSRLKDAIADCTAALKLDDKYMKALMKRAKLHMDIGDYDEAVKDYQQLHKMDKSSENKRLLQDAKLALKRSKRKDYYKILGVERTATDDEIKKAYRKRALVHHPDRHANASEEEKKDQEKKFKELGEAYSVLSDAKKKARYDSGQDMDEMDGGMYSDIDPTQMFQTFFSNGPGAQFSFGGDSGACGGGGFPGGFSFQFG